MRYQLAKEVTDSIDERPFSKGFSWFVLLLIIFFFFGFYSIVISSNYISNQILIETGEFTQSVMFDSPEHK